MTMNAENIMTRRYALSSVGFSTAAVGIGSSFGGLDDSDKSLLDKHATAAPLEDPTTKYPAPPFESQSQLWPGLGSKMKPQPDHGEKSYRGSGRLDGRKALITGGDSGIGRAAAIVYPREGADVAINYFPTEKPDAEELLKLIRAARRKAVAIPGDLRDEAFCQNLVAKAVRELEGLDILVSNAARQQTHDSILDITTEQFDWAMKPNI